MSNCYTWRMKCTNCNKGFVTTKEPKDNKGFWLPITCFDCGIVYLNPNWTINLSD